MRLRLRIAGAFIAACGACQAQAEGERTPLAPYQMVRSLQVLQDRVADGDHAALPMQNKLIELIDKRLRDTTSEDMNDRRNFRALLIYGMSGGNPVTLEMLSARLDLPTTDQRLLAGVHAYTTGRLRVAQAALKPFDATKLRPELGAFLSLVQGSLISKEAPADALLLLDHARLLGPGTLVEEAALRRTMALTATLNDAARFQRTADQYIRRFIRSPYASQFVDGLIEGIIALSGSIELDKIAAILALMTPEQQRFVYLKLARISAIDNLVSLNNFATAKARAVDEGEGGADPRTLLYASVPSVTSETVDEALARLKTIDRSRLSPNDRLLLEAAEAIADSVTARPLTTGAAGAATNDVPETEPMPLPGAQPDEAEPVERAAEKEDPSEPSRADWISSARAKLDAVDAILEESTQ